MTHDAILRAVLDNPDDDAPRLVYADWLEDNGEPGRAEFIRAQCERARLPRGDGRRAALRARERELLARHGLELAGPLRPWLAGAGYRRGLPESVTVPPNVYLEHAGDIVRLAPVRRFRLRLTGCQIDPAVVELLPESVARENVIIPVGFRGRTLVLAAREATDDDLFQKITFILNRDIHFVGAPADQITDAITRHYGDSETESVVSCTLREFPDFDLDPADGYTPIAKLVRLMVLEALAQDVTEIHLEPEPDRLRVSYRIDGQLAERDDLPRRLLTGIVDRLRHLAGADAGHGDHFPLSVVRRDRAINVRISETDNGPRVLLTIGTAAR
jgi:uncharacterized protein (TIGR02996 family)